MAMAQLHYRQTQVTIEHRDGETYILCVFLYFFRSVLFSTLSTYFVRTFLNDVVLIAKITSRPILYSCKCTVMEFGNQL